MYDYMEQGDIGRGTLSIFVLIHYTGGLKTRPFVFGLDFNFS